LAALVREPGRQITLGARLTRSLRGRAALVGVGETPVGKVPGRSGISFHIDAAANAIEDSGLPKSAIDGVISAFSYVDAFQRESLAVAEYLGIRPRFSPTWQTSGSTGASMIAGAAAAVTAGLADTVLVTAGDNRLSGMSRDGAVKVLAEHTNAEYERPYGLTAPALQALYARRHMHEFGTTPEQLAAVAVTLRQHAILTGRAHMREPLTVADVLGSKLVASPYHVLDCALISDGGAAAIVTASELAADLRHLPVYVLGAGEASDHEHTAAAPSLTTSAARVSGQQAYAMAGLGPRDVDVAEIYDCFTGTFLIHLEDLGFCAKGEGGPFVESGEIGLQGSIPCSTHGGLLSYCHSGMAGGLFHVVEAVRQLRGACGARQVRDAEVALVHGMGGMLSCHTTLILGTRI
jgi:acetyl-CoA acetyltransferase